MKSVYPQEIISVIVPVYNAEDCLRQCLDSLLHQTYKPLEIILVNDGSKDSSGEICMEYSQKNPGKIIFLSGVNGGSSVARNRGLEAAHGQWIGFCDADDQLAPEFFEYLYSLAVENAAELSSCAMIRGKDVATAKKIMVTEVSGVELWPYSRIRQELIKPLLRLDKSPAKPVHGYITLTLFQRAIVEAHHIRFRPGMAIHQDEPFFFEYIQYISKAVLSDRVLYYYINHQESACNRHLTKTRKQFTRLEKYWCMRWQERWRVYNQCNLVKDFPEALAPLYLVTRYHELQCINSDSSKNSIAKFRAFKRQFHEMTSEALYKKIPQTLCRLSKDNRRFYCCSRLGVLFVWLFCKGVEIIKNRSFT